MTQMVKLQESESMHRIAYQRLEGFIPDSNSRSHEYRDRSGKLLGRAENNQADFGRDAQSYWSAYGAQATIHVNMSHWARSGGEERRAECSRGRRVGGGAVIGPRRKERT